MTDGLVEVSAGLTMQRGQPAVGGDQPGEHAEASLECEHGPLTMP